jgi:hypothetical protein
MEDWSRREFLEPRLPDGGRSCRVALVAAEWSLLADRIKTGLHLSDYHQGSPEFMPVGNEYGLFILVRSGRTWLGGTSQATIYPVEVLVRGDQPKRLTWEGLPYLVRTSSWD